MSKTTVDIYTLLHQRCSDDMVLQYVKKRNEVITCRDTCLTYISNHLQQTLEHRKWLYFAFLLISESLTGRDREKLYQLILHHDLSKFSAVEIIGYSLKFGRKGRELSNPSNIALWDLALSHHYLHNAHHPQHRADNKMSTIHLLESIVDMLACRMQRVLAGHSESTTEAIFDVPLTFLQRYTEKDRKKVMFYLSSWSADVLSSTQRTSLGKTLLM